MLFLHKKLKRLPLVTLILLLASTLASIEYEPKKEEAKEFFKEGYILYNQARYWEAVLAFEEAAKRAPQNPDYLYWLGKAHYRMGQISECANTWRRYLSLKEDRWTRLRIMRFLLPPPIEGKRLYGKIGSIEGRTLKKGRFLNPVSFCMDSAQNLYICSFTMPKILKFTHATSFIESFEDYLTTPISITMDEEENIFVLDFKQNAILKINKKGEVAWRKGGEGAEEGKFFGPEKIAFFDGYLWVVDSGNARIQKFDEDGDFLLSFGKRGEGAAHFLHPASLCIERERNLWIADSEKRCIKKFDRFGNFLLSINLGNNTPTDLHYHKDYIYISTKEGKLLRFCPRTHSLQTVGKGGSIYLDLFISAHGLFYLSDFEGDKIDVYAPSMYAEREFDVFVEKVYWGAYPKICLWTRVRGGEKDLKGLGAQNFKVVEEDRRVFPINVARAKGALYLILMDTSDQMRPFDEDVKKVLFSFIKGLLPNEAAAIITYGERMKVVVKPTFNKSKLLYKLRKISYSMKTDPYTLSTALFESLRCFGNLGCKRLIILFCCKEYKSPLLNLAIESVYRNIVPVCIIDYNEEGKSPLFLRIAERSRGLYIHAHKDAEHERLLERIKKKMDEQYIYVLTYQSPVQRWKGSFVKVDVASGYFGLYAEDREGYIVP